VRSSFTPRVRELTEGMATLHTAICPVLVGDFGATAHAIAKGIAPFLPTATNQLLIMYREGQIKPHIDSSFHFAQAAQAHLRLQEGKKYRQGRDGARTLSLGSVCGELLISL
jgi:NADPH:quinone reductase-like Zn-dependent oxidoreductase